MSGFGDFEKAAVFQCRIDGTFNNEIVAGRYLTCQGNFWPDYKFLVFGKGGCATSAWSAWQIKSPTRDLRDKT